MLSKGSFEDFLYILVGIIWVAFSIYKGSKRKKPGPKPNIKKDKSFFESLLEEVTKQDQQADAPFVSETPLDETLFPSENKMDERIFSYDDAYEKENFNEPEVILATDEPLIKADRKTEQQVTERKKLRFDLKKAIIYSEILQPKYF